MSGLGPGCSLGPVSSPNVSENKNPTAPEPKEICPHFWVFTGRVLHSNPHRYPHVCNICDAKLTLKFRIPLPPCRHTYQKLDLGPRYNTEECTSCGNVKLIHLM
jgi:hypothetical protein